MHFRSSNVGVWCVEGIAALVGIHGQDSLHKDTLKHARRCLHVLMSCCHAARGRDSDRNHPASSSATRPYRSMPSFPMARTTLWTACRSKVAVSLVSRAANRQVQAGCSVHKALLPSAISGLGLSPHVSLVAEASSRALPRGILPGAGVRWMSRWGWPCPRRPCTRRRPLRPVRAVDALCQCPSLPAGWRVRKVVGHSVGLARGDARSILYTKPHH